MAGDFHEYEDEEPEPKRDGGLFLWTVFILLLIGTAFACWLGSFYVFGHPEVPRAYRILQKLHKIEAPRRFEVTAAPQGEFLSAQKLFERYVKMSPIELERENAELLRGFIHNYRETKKKVAYVRGTFNILDSYELKPTDFFGSGIVALAQSREFPKLLIEHVFTAPRETLSDIRSTVQTGLPFPIERTNDLSAVIHVERISEGRMQLTVVPLLYGSYAQMRGVGTFSLEPPTDLNIEAGVPIIKGPAVRQAFAAYATYRRKQPGGASDIEPGAAAPPPGPELVRLDAIPEGVKVPLTGALPEMPVATPLPIPGKTAKLKTPGPARATPSQILAMQTTPRPSATPRAATPFPARAEPSPAAPTPLPKTSPQGVPLTPFLAANPAPGLPTATSGTWRSYSPGQLPPGRRITPEQARELADRGDLGERLYLRGQFVVTASGENRAVLRPQGTVTDPQQPGGGTRVMVQFPLGAVAPTEGTTFTRDDARPFEIVDVRRGKDGMITIFVREIIAQ